MGPDHTFAPPNATFPTEREATRATTYRTLLTHPALAALGIFTLAFAMRAIQLAHSWDIHVDEITYLRLADEIAKHWHLRLYGAPFYLHPPGFFYLEALVLKIAQPGGYVIEQIYAIRYLNTTLAALSAVMLLILGRRLGGLRVGFVAATIFSLDPFVIRITSRNMLETPSLFWILLGYTALITASSAWPSRWRVAAGGGAFGMALLTKDMTAFLTLLPLGICFVTGWVLPRKKAILAGVIALAMYAVYPLVTFLAGDFQYFANQKLRGLQRFTGVVKESGYKRHGGPSLIGSILANIDQFVTTYAILLLGMAAVLVLFLYGGPRLRLVTVWVASAYALLTYSIAFGTLEEQFFYFLTVPAILAIPLAGSILLRREALSPARRALPAYLITVLTLAFYLWSGYIWEQVHTVPDNGYEHVRAYMLANVPLGARVGVTTEPAVFLMDGFSSGSWGSPEELQANHAAYVLVSTKEMAQGLGYADAGLGNWLAANGRPIYSFTGRSNGTLILYALGTASTATTP